MATLDALPREILDQIVDLVDLTTFSRLRRTSTTLARRLQLGDLPAAQRIRFMQAADRLPQNEDLLACYRCCAMLAKSRFGLGQRRGRRRKSSAKPAADRFCLDCAAQGRLYAHMESVVLRKKGSSDSGRLMLCHRCGRYGTKYRHCGPREGGTLTASGSGEDVDDAAVEWKCWSDSEGSADVPALEALPTELLGQISSLLSYPDAISLASTCAQLRKSVDYSCVPVQARFDFIAQRDAESPWQRKGLVRDETSVCYACFRVRSTDMFTNEQLYLVDTQRKIPYWQRRCRNCLYKMHANKDASKALEAWRKQRLCEGCHVLGYEDSACQSDNCPQSQDARQKRRVSENNDHLEEMDIVRNTKSVGDSPPAPPTTATRHPVPTDDLPRRSSNFLKRARFEIRASRQTCVLNRTLPRHAPRLRKVKKGPGPLVRLSTWQALVMLRHWGFREADAYLAR